MRVARVAASKEIVGAAERQTLDDLVTRRLDVVGAEIARPRRRSCGTEIWVVNLGDLHLLPRALE